MSSNQFIIDAWLSILFYGLLGIVSAYYLRKFYLIKQRNPAARYYKHFDDIKFRFFLILTLCAFADIPIYFGCLLCGGPVDCEWDSMSYNVTWLFHLFALWGYTYTIITPCIMWSDMISKKDGKLFTSKYPVDWMKRTFQVLFIINFFSTLINFVGAQAYAHYTDYAKYSEFYSIYIILDPSLIFIICICCLYTGIRLQFLMKEARLGSFTSLPLLLEVNLSTIIITVTYVGRGLLVLRLSSLMPHSYQNTFESSDSMVPLYSEFLLFNLCHASICRRIN
jgi:hypothetical protein